MQALDLTPLAPQAWLVSVTASALALVKLGLLLRGERRETHGAGNGTRDSARTLAIVEQQQRDLHVMIEAQREDRTILREITANLGRMVLALDRNVGNLTALSANMQMMQRDLEDHKEEARTAMQQVADLHRREES